MNYYYLIAGLPDLSLDEDSPIIDTEEVVDTIRRNLTPADEAQLRYLIYPNDHRNFLNVLFHKFHSFPPLPFITPTTLTESDLQNYHQQQSVFPSYLGEFISSHEDQFTTLSPRQLEETLWELFYDEVEQQDSFIADYFRFNRQLKEMAAIYNAANYSFLSEPTTTEDREVKAIGGGRAIPATWLRDYPYLEDLGESVNSKNPDRIARFMDQVRWHYLEDVSGFFGREQVFTYTLKLLIVVRWQQLAQVPGTTRFEDLLTTIKETIQQPKTSVL